MTADHGGGEVVGYFQSRSVRNNLLADYLSVADVGLVDEISGFGIAVRGEQSLDHLPAMSVGRLTSAPS